MNALETRLNTLNAALYSNLSNIKATVSKLLQAYSKNFPTYTDHSIEHSQQVMDLAAELLNPNEVLKLNADEIYILCSACILHDVGMCIPEEKIQSIAQTEDLIFYKNANPNLPIEIYIRNIHHLLSNKFILEEWESLGIISEKYAEAIGLVAQGHRKVDLNDFDSYKPQFFVKTGRNFVCLPFLACIIRIADELDVTNLRTPDILCKYYLPDSEISRKEWEKHKSTIQINFNGNIVEIEAKCTDNNLLAALEEQFEKIQHVITSCQKTIRAIGTSGDRHFSLEITTLLPKYRYINFDPKGIKYSFEVKNVINAFVGKDLYNNNNAAIREAVQNAIDACNYKKSIIGDTYQPKIIISITENEIAIEDNGQGMDEFIIENYFGKLASSFYDQQEIKNEFQAIGQFGIGVFSYFLISDYIDVETKRKNETGLKFRTDQDPNGYFHFFDNFHKDNDGTKLILHLREEFIGKFPINYIEKFIEKTFPYINFPIIINEGSTSVTITSKDFSLDYERDVVPKMYFASHEFKSKLNLFSCQIKTNDFEGSVGLIVPASSDFSDLRLASHFNSQSFSTVYYHDRAEIQISQKGVYINNYAGRFSFEIGKINIINKLNINLDRTNFRNRQEIISILEICEAQVLEKLFQEYLPSINITSGQSLTKFTDWFLENNWAYENTWLTEERRKSIVSNFRLKIYVNGIIKYLTLKEISEAYDELHFIFSEIKHKALDKKNKNILITPLRKARMYYNIFERFLDYGISIDNVAGENVIVLKKQIHEEFTTARNVFDSLDCISNIVVMNTPKMALNILDNQNVPNKLTLMASRYYTIRINIRHVLIKKLIENFETINKNNLQRKLIEELIDLIANGLENPQSDRGDKDKLLEKINLLIHNLNKLDELQFDFLKIDEF